MLGIVLILFAVLLLLSFISFLQTWKHDEVIYEQGLWNLLLSDVESKNLVGKLGGWMAYIFIKRWFGIASFLFIPIFFIIGLQLINVKIKGYHKLVLFIALWMFYISIFLGKLFPTGSKTLLAGIIGVQTAYYLNHLIGSIGNVFFLIAIFFILLYFTSRTLFFQFIKNAKQTGSYIVESAGKMAMKLKKNQFESTLPYGKEILEDSFDLDKNKDNFEHTQIIDDNENGVPFEIITTSNSEQVFLDQEEEIEEDAEIFEVDDFLFDPRLELSDYKLPVVDLLDEYGQDLVLVDKKEIEQNKKHIEQTLSNYGITISKIYATVGPTVTLYEIVPSPGIRISKIKNLEDDIALSLSALGIRIIAPVPGKGTIGIEVPNKNPSIVSFRSIVLSPEFQNTTYELPLALGKTIDNKPFIIDLTKMPHVLMAGATGQGKSVGLNTAIASLLYKKHPAELKFVLVDPKKVELPLYSQIEKHFLAKLPNAQEAIITDTSQVVKTLKGLITLMEKRYDLLKDAHVRNILEYNRKFLSRKLNPAKGHSFMPYIVVIIDEFADLFMTAGREVEIPLARLAQLARAIGIHLIIATQRPSVNIITGIIKANFPARIAFRVSAKVDSRTILDTGGAEQLIGRGDMLFSSGGNIERLQCAYIDTTELEKIAHFIGSQKGFNSAFELPFVPDSEEEKLSNEFSNQERDPLFEEAARIIVQSQHGSTSLLQRKLKLGYNRAGRLIDQLEAAGIVGPFEGSKAREVLIKDLDNLEQLLQKLNKN